MMMKMSVNRDFKAHLKSLSNYSSKVFKGFIRLAIWMIKLGIKGIMMMMCSKK